MWAVWTLLPSLLVLFEAFASYASAMVTDVRGHSGTGSVPLLMYVQHAAF